MTRLRHALFLGANEKNVTFVRNLLHSAAKLELGERLEMLLLFTEICYRSQGCLKGTQVQAKLVSIVWLFYAEVILILCGARVSSQCGSGDTALCFFVIC